MTDDSLPQERFDDPTEQPQPAQHPLAAALTTVVLPVVIVVMGLGCAGLMVMSKGSAERIAAEPVVAQVTVRELAPTARTASIKGTGSVRAARLVRLTPQVQGTIVRQAASLAPGSRFKKGDVLASVDGRDYRAAVAAQEQAVAQAQLNLATERNRGALAKKEWELLGKGGDASPLTLRIPHLNASEKGLEAAEAALEQAKANLGRTQIRAPFNGIITEETLEIGQLVGPGQPVATLIGTDVLWVEVSMPVEKLDGIRFPSGGNDGSTVGIVQRLGAGKEVRRTGRVLQIGGQLDPQSRTATVLVEVPDPYNDGGLPLLPGAHVTAEIDGRSLQDTWEIDRVHIEDGRFAWVVDQEGALRKRALEIGWKTPRAIIATGGFHAGDRLVTSTLALPVDGQTVTAIGEEG